LNAEGLTLSVHVDAIGAEDATFHEWATAGLVWLPERGMGFYPVAEQPYDAAYFEKYQRYAATPMGYAITAARANLVMRHALPRQLVDVGIGCGDFVLAMGDGAFGFDVNPAGVSWLEERGRFRDPREHPVDILTFWDAIEHLPDAAAFVAAAREWVFCSLPIVPGDGPPPLDWKHFRRDEHCWYWTRAGLIRWMSEQGFECVEVNAMETLLGREDIESFAFRRRA
jgi:hypothetical protein